MTEQFIDSAKPLDQSTFACEDFAADFGDSQAWNGLSAGEPEQFSADTSVDQHQKRKQADDALRR